MLLDICLQLFEDQEILARSSNDGLHVLNRCFKRYLLSLGQLCFKADLKPSCLEGVRLKVWDTYHDVESLIIDSLRVNDSNPRLIGT